LSVWIIITPMSFLLRVDPEVGAVGSVPAEAALGNAAAGGDGVADDFDAESIASARTAPGERGRGTKYEDISSTVLRAE
jgi:hypothetical protein